MGGTGTGAIDVKPEKFWEEVVWRSGDPTQRPQLLEIIGATIVTGLLRTSDNIKRLTNFRRK